VAVDGHLYISVFVVNSSAGLLVRYMAAVNRRSAVLSTASL